MRLTPPTTITFVIGVLLLLVALVLQVELLESADLYEHKFWIAWAGGAVLALGAAARGL